MLSQAFLWRLLDLTEVDGRPIDLVVATKFPSYVVRHPEKRVWLVHQFRQAHDLDGTELGQFDQSPEGRAIRRKVHDLDRVSLGEATRLFATSGNVAGRLESSTGLIAEVLHHPPQTLDYRCESYDGFVLSASRLDRAKRLDVLVEAAALDPSLEVVLVSDGPDRDRLESLGAVTGSRRAHPLRRTGYGGAAGRAVRALRVGVLRPGRRGLRDGAIRELPRPRSP